MLRIFPKLEKEDFKVLAAVEFGMASHAYTPVEDLVKLSGLHEKELSYRLRRLNKFKLLIYSPSPRPGFTLNSLAYDCLALHSFVESGVLEAVGPPIAMGKESDVYLGLAPDRSRLALKFMRIGRTSFRQTRRLRSYVELRGHISWLYQCRLAARREYDVLTKLHCLGVRVPRPVAWNRHLLALGFFEGVELAYYGRLGDPQRIFKSVVGDLRRVYLEAGVIHGDLSEYNVLVSEDEDFMVIDWPQYVTVDDPDAEAYLRRDLGNLSSFFSKKQGLDVNVDRVVAYVKGLSSRL